MLASGGFDRHWKADQQVDPVVSRKFESRARSKVDALLDAISKVELTEDFLTI